MAEPRNRALRTGSTVLLLLGFTSLAPQPVLLALVQDEMPENRAFANGVYLMMTFLTRSLVLVLLGAADVWVQAVEDVQVSLGYRYPLEPGIGVVRW